MPASSLPLPWRLQALASGDGDSNGVGEGLTMDSEAAAGIRFVGDGCGGKSFGVIGTARGGPGRGCAGASTALEMNPCLVVKSLNVF
jgi:hypothetical protein